MACLKVYCNLSQPARNKYRLSAFENESDSHRHAVLRDLSLLDHDFLFSDPCALDVLERCVCAGDSLANRVLETLGGSSDDFRDFGDSHVSSCGFDVIAAEVKQTKQSQQGASIYGSTPAAFALSIGYGYGRSLLQLLV